MTEQDKHKTDLELAIEAVEFCIAKSKWPNLSDEDLAIWSVGTSDKPRITIKVLKTLMNHAKESQK